MRFESHIAEQMRGLDGERSRSLGAWEFEPAKNSGYITTIFGRYQSGEPAGLAYTCCGDADQQNADAAFICAAANSIGPLLDERAQMMTRMATLRASIKELLPIIEAVRYTAGLGKNQLERVERAKKLLLEDDGPSQEQSK